MAVETLADHSVPKGALRAGAIIISLSILFAALGRYADIGTSHVVRAPIIASVDLRFADGADGSVIVTQVPGDRIIAVLAPGTNGFIRGTLRGLVRMRKLSQFGPEIPFTLSRQSDGRLTLLDPTNGQALELNGFGVTNVGAFESLMQAAGRNG